MYDWKKTTVLFICIHKRVKLIVFAVSIKFCDESGLAIFSGTGSIIPVSKAKKKFCSKVIFVITPALL